MKQLECFISIGIKEPRVWEQECNHLKPKAAMFKKNMLATSEDKAAWACKGNQKNVIPFGQVVFKPGIELGDLQIIILAKNTISDILLLHPQ